MDNIIGQTSLFLPEIVEIVNFIDGPFEKIYEAGIFVSCIATTKILLFKHCNPTQISDEFHSIWVEMLANNLMEGSPPAVEIIQARMQEKWPIYNKLFMDIINHKNNALGNPENHPIVQLTQELFCNCTDKENPEEFEKLLFASKKIGGFVVEIFQAVKE